MKFINLRWQKSCLLFNSKKICSSYHSDLLSRLHASVKSSGCFSASPKFWQLLCVRFPSKSLVTSLSSLTWLILYYKKAWSPRSNMSNSASCVDWDIRIGRLCWCCSWELWKVSCEIILCLSYLMDRVVWLIFFPYTGTGVPLSPENLMQEIFISSLTELTV